MQQELFKVQIAARELEVKLGKDHPLVKVQKDREQQLKEILAQETEERPQTKVGINTARQALELEVRREQAMAASLRAKDVRLKQQIAALHGRMRSLNDQEVQIVGLERQAELAEANYKRYAQHLEQARIVEALEANRISSVNVVQPPSLVQKPISPKPTLILGMGLMAALFGAIALPFVWEKWGHLIHRGRVLDPQPVYLGVGAPRAGHTPLNC
jgi:uncharacterized protein involved in exopolysaccharide biosynthesis